MKKIALWVALFMLIAAAPGWCMCAVHTWVDEKANSESYPVKAGGMLLRGLVTIVTSPAELACHLYKEPKDNFEYGAGIARGFGKGLLYTFDNIIRGGWDILSFAFPDYHGEPVTHKNECWGDGATDTDS